jgi:hypothetical protein
MTVFALTLAIFVAVVFLMAVGVILSGKKIQGSCGGLGAAMTNDKGEKVCGYCGLTFEQQQQSGCGDPERSPG